MSAYTRSGAGGALWCHRLSLYKLTMICLAAIVTTTFLLAIQASVWSCSTDKTNTHRSASDLMTGDNSEIVDVNKVPVRGKANDDQATWGPHKLAVIVPFQDRFDELLEFVPHMEEFLNKKKIRHRFYIINQADEYRFNRASLINIGYLMSSDCDYLAMHDVDLLPMNLRLNYSYPKLGPFHVAAPNLHPKYHYPRFVGGILLLTREQFKKVNGMSNRFWGWGREDDEFYLRMREANLQIYRPGGITTGFNTFKHIHDKQRRSRDKARYGNQKKESRKRDRVTGMETVAFDHTVQNLHIDGIKVTIVNVHLHCDMTDTPWCAYPTNPRKT